MSRPVALLHRWLPPVLVLAGLSALVLSTRRPGGAARQREEAVLLAEVSEAGTRAAAGRDVEAYLARFGGDPAARWFAIDMHARRLDVGAALAAFQGDPALGAAPAEVRRFATILLRRLGDQQPGGPPASWLFPHALLARLDTGDPDASALLDRVVSEMGPQDLVNFYLPAHRATTPGSLAMATAWMRRASDPVYLAAASGILARPGATQIADRIRPLVESSWRTERPVLWGDATRTLGTVGDPASLEALRRERAMATGGSRDDQRRRLACSAGLAVAGDAEARATVLGALEDRANDWVGVETALGLFARLRGGDLEAAPAIVELAKRRTARTTLLQIGMCSVVSEDVPAGLPVEQWLADLAHSPVRTARVIVHVWSLRRKEPGAAAALLADLADAVRGHDVASEAQSPDDDRGAAVIEVLRALARWG